MAKNKKRMRRGQMIAIAALMTSAVAPYAVSADTTGSVTTDAGGTSKTLDVTASEAVTTTSADTTTVDSSYIETGVDYKFTIGTSIDELSGSEGYLKAFVGDVNLEIAADGKKYVQLTLQGNSYAFTSITDLKGNAVEVISSTGSVADKNLVRVIRVALDDKYQVSLLGASEGRPTTQFNFDLSQEKFDFDFDSSLPSNNSYFKLWTPNADVVTLKDGKKVAYVTFAGHSYAIPTIFEGANTSKAATVVSSSGSAEGKDLTRVVRLELDDKNKAQAYLDGGEKGGYTFSFNFTEKAAVPNFATVAELSKAAGLAVVYAAVDATAGSWHPMAFPSAASNPVAKAVNGKIEVSYDLTKVKAFKATQDGKDVAVTVANDKATFTVDSLEGLAFEVTAEAERNGTVTEATYKVSLTKAVVDPTIIVEENDTPAIPATTDVKGKKATVSFKASSESLNSYFQHGFFGGVEIVEIDGQSYADLNIVEKSIGLEYDYIMPNGSTADVLEVSGNRATQNGNYEGFSAIVRIPVTVDANGAYEFTLATVGGQPGSGSSAAYEFTFTGKIQSNVTLPYNDIKDATTKEYVQQLANWGALNLGLEKFNPGGELTRGQFALMIARALDLKPAKANQFKDVKDNELQAAVQALFEAGVVGGYDNNTAFKPNNKITRTQAALMIQRLLVNKLGYKTTATADDANFNDADEIKGAEAKLAFGVLKEAGIMTGSNGFINPNSKLKRSQMAKILVEALNKAGFEK